ncbi:MAG: Ger(x)C family spore germination protein [Bacillota bacterium]
MSKKICLLLIFFLITLIPSGCWNSRELDTLSFVMALGIDKDEAENKITLTAQILKPAEVKAPTGGGMSGMGGSGSTKGVWVATRTGKTVFDALRNFTFEADRKLFLSFTRVVVIGEEAARAGVAPLMDILQRDHEFRRNIWVLVAKGKAKDVLEAEHDQEKIPARAIEKLIKVSAANSMVPMVNLKDFLAMMAGKSRDPFAAAIEAFEKRIDEGDKDQEGGEKKEKRVKRVKTGGTAVFKKDRLAGWLDNTETRGLLWILGKVRSGIIVIPAPEGSREQEISLEIIRAESKLKPKIEDGKIYMTIEIKEEGNLGEQMAPGDPAKPEKFKLLEEKQAKVIEREVRAALEKAQQEWGVDVFGFGEAVHQAYPKEWEILKKRWDEEFPMVEVEIKVEAKLSRLGLITKHVMSE